MPYAAVVYKTDEPMKIEEVTYREPREGEVLVKLAACGVCHSDLSVLNELFPCATPVILGHEAAGVVESVGPGVTTAAKGDHVIGVWKPSCGTCRYCRAGKQHLCRLGEDPTSRATDRVTSGGNPVFEFLGVGGFSEYTILHEGALAKIPADMPLDKAALLGCAVLTGFGAAQHCAKVGEGQEVAVFGCGGVGLNIVQGAKHARAKTIIAVDIDPAKLELARQFGATHTIDGKDENIHKSIKKLTDESQGVDFAFDAVGHVGLASTGYRSLAKGGEVVLVGIPHMKEKLPVSPFQSVMMEKTVKGSLAGSIDCMRELPRLVSLYQSGELMLDELVSRSYSIQQANDAMNDLREGKNARGVLVFD